VGYGTVASTGDGFILLHRAELIGGLNYKARSTQPWAQIANDDGMMNP